MFGYGWGVKNFGTGVSSADIVEDYLNTDDPVPTTSDPVIILLVIIIIVVVIVRSSLNIEIYTSCSSFYCT